MTETTVIISEPVPVKESDQKYLNYLREEMQSRVQNVLDFQESIKLEDAAMVALKNLWRRFTSEIIKSYKLEGNWEVNLEDWTLRPTETVMEE